MRPRIIFLGTAGNLGVVSRQLRSSGGMIIQSDDCQLHIDPGPGALTNAAQCGINVRGHTAIFVTHPHLNHANDLNALIAAMTLNGLDNHGVLVTPESVLGSQQAKPVLTEHFAKQLEKIIIVQPHKKLAIGQVEVQVLPAEHHEPSAVGYRLLMPGLAIAYSGDTDYATEIAGLYADTDVLVLNCQNPGKSRERGLCSADIVKIIRKARPKLCILTHFSQKMSEANPIYEAREIKRQTGAQVIAAEDGMTIDPASYDAEARQKTLGSFTAKGQAASRQDSLQ